MSKSTMALVGTLALTIVGSFALHVEAAGPTRLDGGIFYSAARGDLLVAGANGQLGPLTVGASARILQSDGTDPSWVAVSGDVTIAAGGAVTIAAGAVEGSMVADDTLTGAKAATYANAATAPGLMVCYSVATGSGANGTTDITIDEKIRVFSVVAFATAAGGTSPTVQVGNAGNAITDAFSISGGDTTAGYAGQINDANYEIAASGTLRITYASGSSDFPGALVFVCGVRSA